MVRTLYLCARMCDRLVGSRVRMLVLVYYEFLIYMDRLYVCICSNSAKIANKSRPPVSAHPLQVGSQRRQASSERRHHDANNSWTPLRWDDPSAGAKVDEFASRHPTTTNELWVEWMKHWMLRDWRDHYVKLTAPAPMKITVRLPTQASQRRRRSVQQTAHFAWLCAASDQAKGEL